MKNKTNCVGPQTGGQVKRVVKETSGRRKFLTTVAGAGAAVILGSRSANAQEERTFSASNPWKGGKKKQINKESVESLLKNAKKEMRVGRINVFGDGNTAGTKNFEYEVSEKDGGFSVMISSRAGGKEEVLFPGVKKANGYVAVFKPKNHDAIADELLVFAGGGKIAVCFQDKNHEMPVLMQFSGGAINGGLKFGSSDPWIKNREKIKTAWGMPNPGKDSSEAVQTAERMKIGYENKGGEVFVISAPENVGTGDKVLAVKISGNGVVSSVALECSEATMGVQAWG